MLQIVTTLIFILLMILNILFFVYLFKKDTKIKEYTVVYTPLNIASSFGLFVASMLLVVIVY